MLEVLGPSAALCRRALTGAPGVALPPLRDHHVHLHLIDATGLPARGLAGVVDLGGDPVRLARHPAQEFPDLAHAGAFLTAPGGYPAGRSWAPDAVVREVTDASPHPGAPGGAATAVDEQVSFGASVIKVTLNADAGPVLDERTLAAIVRRANEHALPVVAHVEGEGMTRRALAAGVAVLAHTPFRERLPDDLIRAAVRAGTAWISTLDIHRDDAEARRLARANLAAFARAGGRVLYGTDLGNGDLPVGVNPRELAALIDAGIDGPGLIAALADPWPRDSVTRGIATFVPGEPPQVLAAVPEWLARATVVPAEELLHDES